jgi:hypothetical protein
MAPRERSGLSLRWEFVPGIEGADRAVHWRWRAFTQAGKLFAGAVPQGEAAAQAARLALDPLVRHGDILLPPAIPTSPEGVHCPAP